MLAKSGEGMGKRVVVAMSGGVDSSVAAGLLREQGYEVIGLFMRTGAGGESTERKEKTCCSVADALDAQRVADELGIAFYALDFEREFGRIVERFISEYFAGRTPNPCVLCNVWLKFGKLWVYGQQVGADYVATGHYARIVRDEAGRARVSRAVDRGKDQSYVLSGLKAETLEHVLLPVGEYSKSEIRALARGWKLPVHDKPDSQEICFIPDNDYAGFIRSARPGGSVSGRIVDQRGEEVGRHEGIEGFTIGQRRGLGVAVGEPRYVTGIDASTATVQIGTREDLEREGLRAERFTWQVSEPEGELICEAQIRARHAGVGARAAVEPGGVVRVRFDEPQMAVTPGQLVTLYDEAERVLGGGWIRESF
jgi:tRNA-specific 2-thiouridylase